MADRLRTLMAAAGHWRRVPLGDDKGLLLRLNAAAKRIMDLLASKGGRGSRERRVTPVLVEVGRMAPPGGTTGDDLVTWAADTLSAKAPWLLREPRARCQAALLRDRGNTLLLGVPDWRVRDEMVARVVEGVARRVASSENAEEHRRILLAAAEQAKAYLDAEWEARAATAATRLALAVVADMRSEVQRLAARAEPHAKREDLQALAERLDIAIEAVLRMARARLNQDGDLERVRAQALVEFRRIAETPPAASDNLLFLLVHVGDRQRSLDQELVAQWTSGGRETDTAADGPKPLGSWERRYPMHAARAAERLTLSWLRARHTGARVIDLSVRQVIAGDPLPDAVATSLRSAFGIPQPNGRIALPADAAVLLDGGVVRFFDTKNTVRASHRLEFLVPKQRLLERRLTFVGTWTEGDVAFRQIGAREALQGEDTYYAENYGYGDLMGVYVHVLGETDSRSVRRFLDFAEASAPNVEFRLGTARRQPVFLFAFPEDAYADQGARRAGALEWARLAAHCDGSLPAAVLGAVATGSRPVGLRRPMERAFARWFSRGLRRRPARAAALPSLGEVYVLALQVLLVAIRRRQARPAALRSSRLLDELPALLLELLVQAPGEPGEEEPTVQSAKRDTTPDFRFPLGAWDPAGIFANLVLAVASLARNARGLSRLPKTRRLYVTGSGTVVALGTDATGTQQHNTLLAHCEACAEWPLVWGRSMPAGPANLENGCTRCGRLICSQGHGCRAYDRGQIGVAAASIEALNSDCLAVRQAAIVKAKRAYPDQD